MTSLRPLTLRGVMTLMVGVCCLVAANLMAAPILLYLALFLFALVVFAVIAVRVPRRTGAVTRRISTGLLTVGEESQVAVRLNLRARGIPFGTWRDRLPDAVTGDATGDFPTDNGADIHYRIAGVRRGIWPIGPLSLHTIDPFGFAQRTQDFGDTRTVTVVPEIVALSPLPGDVGAAGGATHTASSRLGQGSDNLSPRKYISGDSMRHVHWRATAHRGDLMVRQEESETNPCAIVVLDRTAGRWAPRDENADPAFEAAVSACASAAIHLAQEGYSVDVRDSAGTLLGTLRGQEDDRDSLLVELAMVAPQGEGRDLVVLFNSAAPGPLVVITGRLDETDAAHFRHGGAASPLLLATELLPGAAHATAELGWSTAELNADVATAWGNALAGRMAQPSGPLAQGSGPLAQGGGNVPR